MMNSMEIGLVADSWKRIEDKSDEAGLYFFKRLFEKQPSLVPLFKNSIQTQQRQYINMLNIIVNGLEQAESLQEALRELGKKHQAYGVNQSHFESMSECLVETIEFCSETALRDDEKRAWQKAFHIFSSMMC